MLLLLLLIGGGSFAWGEDFSATFSYGSLKKDWTLTNYTPKGDYYLVPSGTEPSVATLSGIFKDKKVTSDVVVTINCATFGNGTNPNAQTFTFYTTSDCSSQISATQSGKLPTSSTYASPVYTISKEDATSLLNDLVIKITKPGKQIRLKSIGVKFSYEAASVANLTSIAVSGTPTKATYKEGEAFDPTGLVVTATYDDESTKVVTDDVKWACTPETLTLGITEVNVTASYGEKTASKTVAVTVTEVQKYNVTWNVNGKVYTEGAPTTEVVEGEKLSTLPTAPASIGGLVFMGWTNEAVTSQEAAPAVLFTSAAEAPAVTTDVTYYAVFAAQAGTGWIRVTELSDITEGSYVIKNADFVLPNTNTGATELPQKVLAPSVTGNVITGEVDESMVWQFVPTGFSNKFYIKNAAGDYLYATNANDGLHVDKKKTTSSQWTFEENGTDYFAMKNAKSSRYCATYKAGKDWRSYTSKSHTNYANGGKLELYRNDISYSNYTTTVETNSLILRAFDGKNHFATFSSDKAVKFVDATVYAVGVNDDRLILIEVESKQVPANTGVLLKSAGTEATYSVIGSAPAIENNLLCASVEEGQTTAADGTTEGYSFFKLSYNQAGENEKLGFYWAKENGAPFVSKAGLAYLAVKTADAAAVKGFSLFDMETGISKVSGSAAGNGVIYDLQGRRVERAVRGLYIVNGRKVMVK